MPPRHRPVREVESLAEFDDLVQQGAGSLVGWRLQSVDLRDRADVVRRLVDGGARGALLLGCLLDEDTADRLRAAGALLFPRVPDAPVDVYRTALYTPEELYAGLDAGYEHTLDARAYSWSRADGGLTGSLSRSLHDHAVDDALEEAVEGQRLVGVMGGHALRRGSPGYRDAAALGRTLAGTGLTIATGGGPGAMEAANLGAYLAKQPAAALDEAVAMLAAAPSFDPSVRDWATEAFAVRDRWPDGGDSLGIPTWFYGHEPPNAMATRIAKYFTNAIREDVLLHVCNAGIVFLPGRAGTVQEVFQDACENYYPGPDGPAPMILVGAAYWTTELPAWPLLEALAGSRPMADRVHLVDDLADVLDLLSG